MNRWMRRMALGGPWLAAAVGFATSWTLAQPTDSPFPDNSAKKSAATEKGPGAVAPGAKAPAESTADPFAPPQSGKLDPPSESPFVPSNGSRPAAPLPGDSPAPGMDEGPFKDETTQPAEPAVPPSDGVPAQDGSQDAATSSMAKAQELFAAGKYTEAIAELEAAVKAAPDNYQAIFMLGVAYRYTGRYDDSIKALTQLAKLEPDELGDILLRRGISWFYKGEHAIAQADFEQAAGLNFNDARPELWRGLALARQNRLRDAISAYSSALRYDPQMVAARTNRGLAYVGIGEYALAINDFNEAIRQNPEDPAGYYKRGVTFGRLGDLRAALNSYDESLRLDPKLALAYLNRSEIHQRLGNSAKAQADRSRAVELDPQLRATAGGR